jgi:3-oxoacyl-[acyl-carrier protein] reductase
MKLDGKVAIVTGASRGIGRGIALLLAKAGADVVVNYNKSANEAEIVVKEIGNLNRKALSLKADVSNSVEVGEMVYKTIREFNKIDILVNNAGISSLRNPFSKVEFEEWDRVLKTNLYGVFYTIKAVLNFMRERRSGNIINISSNMTRRCPAIGSPYIVAKSAIETLTKVLAKEEAGNGIRVNAIAPGLIETEMGERYQKENTIKEMAKNIPIGRIGLPQDIGNMVVYLASEYADFITGQVIYINGGMDYPVTY